MRAALESLQVRCCEKKWFKIRSKPVFVSTTCYQERQVSLTLLKGAQDALAHTDCIHGALNTRHCDTVASPSLNSFASLAKPVRPVSCCYFLSTLCLVKLSLLTSSLLPQNVTQYASAFDDEAMPDASSSMSLCETLSRTRLDSECSASSLAEQTCLVSAVACSPQQTFVIACASDPSCAADVKNVNQAAASSPPSSSDDLQEREQVRDDRVQAERMHVRDDRIRSARAHGFLFYYQGKLFVLTLPGEMHFT